MIPDPYAPGGAVFMAQQAARVRRVVLLLLGDAAAMPCEERAGEAGGPECDG
jgi:hypothetical protein